ncbi:MAG: PAS domain-containing sensor histidine kinase [Promethearchaeota archaeon]|nr:MAG: PAS domain-containing sensor histidine kinase [Candidatus Lokiarchaeota archaeon]
MTKREDKSSKGKQIMPIARPLIETMNEGYFEVDLKGNFTYSNPSHAQLMGYSPRELIGTNYQKYMTEKEANATFKVFNEIFKTEKAKKSFIYQFFNKNQEPIHVESSIYLRYDEDGNKLGFSGFIRDITVQIRTERRLKKSERDYRNIIENIEEGYFELNLQGNFTYFNPACCDILGYNPQEMIGMNYREYTSKEEAKRTFKTFNEVYEKNSPNLDFQFDAIRKDGKKIYCECSIYLRHDSNGDKIGFRGIIRDVTARVEAKQRLRKSEEKYRKIIENTREGYFEVDLAGSFTYFNNALRTMLGYSQEEMMGMNYMEYMTEQKANETFQIFNKVYKTEETHVSFEYELISKENKKLYGESSVYLRYDKKGNKIGFSGFVRDVTNLREAYNRAEFYREILSHDIRNMLNSIRLSFEYIQETEESILKSPELKEMADIIEKQVNRASKLILNIQKLSSIEKKGTSVKKVNLTEIIDNVIKNVKDRSLSNNIFIDFKPPKKSNVVYGGKLLNEAFENIVLNGITHNTFDKKIILIKCSYSSIGKQDYIKVEFIDNGIGIPDAQKDKIFSRSYKNEKARGMGIGLSLVKEIIENYNGKIQVKNRVNGDYTKGSNFIVFLKKV